MHWASCQIFCTEVMYSTSTKAKFLSHSPMSSKSIKTFSPRLHVLRLPKNAKTKCLPLLGSANGRWISQPQKLRPLLQMHLTHREACSWGQIIAISSRFCDLHLNCCCSFIVSKYALPQFSRASELDLSLHRTLTFDRSELKIFTANVLSILVYFTLACFNTGECDRNEWRTRLATA